MMNREMMEEIFENVCRENNMAWYEVFDGDLFEQVCETIARAMGLDIGEYDSWREMLDWEVGGEFSEWIGEMGGDL